MCGPPLFLSARFVAARVRDTWHHLRHLDVNTATGPDKLPARVLKELLLCSRSRLPSCAGASCMKHAGLRDGRSISLSPFSKRNPYTTLVTIVVSTSLLSSPRLWKGASASPCSFTKTPMGTGISNGFFAKNAVPKI